MAPIRIAIVGGGLSGLATGVHLRLLANCHRLPLEITLFEASSRIGGVIQTERIVGRDGGEFVVDHGADMFATNPPAAIELCQRLGVADGLLRPQQVGRGAMIARGDRLIPIPDGFVLMRATKMMSMVSTPLLSPRGKLRLLAERFVRPRDPSLEDESVGSFVARRLGRECLQNIVAPLVAGIYTADIDRLSMAATMKPLWDMEARDGSLARATLRRKRSGEDATERTSSGARYEQFRAFPGGMIELIQALASGIGSDNIRLNSPVESLATTANGTELGPGGESFDRVVLASPAPVSAQLLATLRTTAAAESHLQAIDTVVSELGGIGYASTAIVVMAVPRQAIARMPKTFGFVVPPSEQRTILAGSFASEKFCGRAPHDHVIIRAFAGGALHPQVLEQSDEAIVEIVANELGDIIGLDVSKSVHDFAAFIKVIRWNKAMPQYEVGHLRKAAAIDSAISQLPNIELVTNAYGGVGIAPVIAAAERGAQRVLASVSKTQCSPE
ncbi:protoporphyrinogen oxidase [Allorhodopirellula heiligendammensis]|uniref:Coproporphyrinogen III oxidase n=1 Tax=Allorhodopirellula heiligendammensis TaxID=2714739 RepID=A0A5C6BYF4_9BACT|nr:protoporphyrinogen oxidase [Allorhodopirellula heiligendammensis]TWU16717.1 Protoporphyrinogen oxidase [Allorhodopirellula heiligendammensis]